MSPQIILYACYGFIFWLLRKDQAWRKTGSLALLIPGCWIAIQGSRPVSYWFGSGGGDSESNPINTVVYGVLILAAIHVLRKRHLKWGALVGRNKAVFLIYGYFALSAIWSELPLASLKRIGKDFGCVLVGLVMLTEANPAAAVRAVYVRVAYLLFPLSVIFIKFFPAIGRCANKAGDNMFTGITTQKNSLGEMVWVLAIIILWDLVEIYKGEDRPGKKIQMAIRAGFLLMGIWLLRTCDSQTSMLCLILGSVILWGTSRLVQLQQGKRILVTCLVVVFSVAALDKTFNLSEVLIRAMGRNPTLTGRTDIWRLIREQNPEPILGAGFYTFWDGSKGQAIIDSFMRINEAHNGFLEMYLDGGLVASALLILMLLVGANRVINGLFSGAPLGRIGLIYWSTAIVCNLSESGFFRLGLLWFTLLLVILNVPRKAAKRRSQPAFDLGQPDPVPLGVGGA